MILVESRLTGPNHAVRPGVHERATSMPTMVFAAPLAPAERLTHVAFEAKRVKMDPGKPTRGLDVRAQ